MATRIKSKGKLILIRHGQSIYNLQNRFTGWKDVELTDKGVDEAKNAGSILKNENISFDLAYTSKLKRAQNTLNLALQEMGHENIPIVENIALNERDYGDLIGQNKAEAAEKFGIEQVQIWRRSYDIPPPGGESLKMTCDRTLPYFKSVILNNVFIGKNVLVSAHGNSIRAIVKFLFNYDADTILKTEIGWCEPWLFEFDNHQNKLIDFKLIGIDMNNSNSNIPFIPKFNYNF